MISTFWKKHSPFCIAVALFAAFQVNAFSPYENFILSGQARQVGLIALADVDDIPSMEEQFNAIPANEIKALEDAGIRNLSVFVKAIQGKGLVFTYFEYDHKCYQKAAELLLKHSPTISKLSEQLTAHPRAEAGSVWLNMEWMNCVGHNAVFPHDSKSIQKMALVSGLQPEKELNYRMLHQTNWPGNTECMVECNYRNWTSFLIELGDELFLFSYTEYVGDDLDADNEKMAANPVTQRWWKHTDACQIKLEGDGYWTLMDRLEQ